MYEQKLVTEVYCYLKKNKGIFLEFFKTVENFNKSKQIFLFDSIFLADCCLKLKLGKLIEFFMFNLQIRFCTFLSLKF